jgi:hypothetical protein
MREKDDQQVATPHLLRLKALGVHHICPKVYKRLAAPSAFGHITCFTLLFNTTTN